MTEPSAPGPYVYCPSCRRVRPSTTEIRVFDTFTAWGWGVKERVRLLKCAECGDVVKSEEAK